MPPISELSSAEPGACRCGSRFVRGDQVFRVADANPTIAGLLDGQSFCSQDCVRAWFLETLSELDALDTPENEKVVVDLRAVFVDLALAYGSIVDSNLARVA